MAGLDKAIGNFEGLVSTIGKGGVSALFPRDFEIYIMAIELVDYNGVTIDYFMFPIMPNSISKSEIERTNIQKTFRGTTVIRSTSFVPKDLTISGSFGRGFKIMIPDIFGDNSVNTFLGYSLEAGAYSADDLNNIPIPKPSFLPFIKTGYGLIKKLQAIIDKAKGFSRSGKPFRLYLYNPALGENYLCELTKNPLTLKQEESGSNMVWNYTLNLKIIGDLDNLNVNSRNLRSLVEQNAIQKTVNRVAKDASKAAKGLV